MHPIKRSKKVTAKIIGLRDFDKMIDNLDLKPVLDNKVRQVKWLYNNSNKLTMVYEEKLVRLMVFKLQQRIKELEEKQIMQSEGFRITEFE